MYSTAVLFNKHTNRKTSLDTVIFWQQTKAMQRKSCEWVLGWNLTLSRLISLFHWHGVVFIFLLLLVVVACFYFFGTLLQLFAQNLVLGPVLDLTLFAAVFDNTTGRARPQGGAHCGLSATIAPRRTGCRLGEIIETVARYALGEKFCQLSHRIQIVPLLEKSKVSIGEVDTQLYCPLQWK